MEITQDLTCPVCLEFYTYPIILSCGHVLCRTPCVENILELNVLRCPVCRDSCYVHGGLSSLPRVISLESIIGKLKAVKQKTRDKTDAEIKPELSEAHHHENHDKSIPDKLPKRSVSRQEKTTECFRPFSPQFIYVLTLLRNASAEISISRETCCQSKEMVPTGQISSPIDDISNITACAEFHSQLSFHSALAVSESGITNVTYTEPWERRITPPSRPITKYDLLLPSWKLFPLTAADARFEHDGYDNFSMSLGPRKTFGTVTDFPTSVKFAYGQGHTDFVGATVSRDESYFQCQSDSLTIQPLITTQDVEEQIEKLIILRQKLLNYNMAMSHETKELQEVLQSRCDVISSELNSLVSELERRTNDVIGVWEEQTTTLKTDADCSHLESQEDRPIANLQEEQRAHRSSINPIPEKPRVDITMCARNSHTVVLTIAPPTEFDFIDYYEVLFGTKEQKHLKMEETLIAQWRPESKESHSFIIIENLCKSTHYFISVSAVNKWGRSPSSDIIQCSTLDHNMDTGLTAPTILESQCYASINVATIVIQPSPHLEEINLGFHEHRFILYRQEAVLGKAYAWSGIRLQDGVSCPEVVGLTPDTDYQFRVMSCDYDGRCELSEKLMLRTISS